MESKKLLTDDVLHEVLRLVGGPSPTCGGLPQSANALRAHIDAQRERIAALEAVLLDVAPAVAVLARADEVAPALRDVLLRVETSFLGLFK